MKEREIKGTGDKIDFVSVFFFQDYNTSNLDKINQRVINKVFSLFLEMIEKNHKKDYNKLQRIYHRLDIKKINEIYLDLVYFRFLFVGKGLKRMEERIREDVEYFAKYTLGGGVELDSVEGVDPHIIDVILKPITDYNTTPTPEEYVLASYYNLDMIYECQRPAVMIEPKK